jgi:CubicO group peptidase (beta-lactamase class C family)
MIMVRRLPALIGVFLLLWVNAENSSEASENDPDLASTIDSLPLLFEPGSNVAYSNIGYGTLAAVLEFVTKQDFEACLEEAVLQPNGLRSTGHFFQAALAQA